MKTPIVLIAWVALIAGIAVLVGALGASGVASAAIAGGLMLVARPSRRRVTPVRMALIGSRSAMDALEAQMRVARQRRHTIVGWIGAAGDGDDDPRHLGTVDDLRSLVLRDGIELLVLGENVPRMAVFEELDRSCRDVCVHLSDLSDFYEEHFGHIPIAEINAVWFRCVLDPRYSDRVGRAKRTFDLLVGVVMAIVFLPVLLVLIALIRLDGGPALYRQRRIGERGRPFTMLKLRSMRWSADPESPWWVPGDDRVTTIGRFVRHTHLDELPQLINVLRGEMTIVGPRPEQPHYVRQLETVLPHYSRRHQLRPGLTGWAQINCGYAGSEQGSLWKLSHDLYYLKHASLWLDVKILLRTVVLPFRRAEFAEPPPRPFVFGLPYEELQPGTVVLMGQGPPGLPHLSTGDPDADQGLPPAADTAG